ncbi:TonB family protein [Undibacterium sp. RuTC16W]|uniref:TonB family protein n=1 Tax=Undibacterium sp. RuTC16W TaxID=3413048 RepID=UPI003BF3D071
MPQLIKNFLGALLVSVTALSYAQDAATTAVPASTTETPDSRPDGDLLSRCRKPEYPMVALRNAFQGNSVIGLNIDESGKIEGVNILKSSGWRILDDTVSSTIMGCQLVATAPNKKMTKIVAYKWSYNGAIEYQPELIPESCAESELVRFASDKERGRGIVVGAYISDIGMPGRFSLEWGSGKPELDRASVELVKTCKFKAASRDQKKLSAPVSLRLFPKNPVQ